MRSNKKDRTCPSKIKVTYLEHKGTDHLKFWENYYDRKLEGLELMKKPEQKLLVPISLQIIDFH